MARKKKNSKILTLFIVVFFSVLLFTLDIGGFTQPLRAGFDVVLNPVRYWFSIQSRSVSTFFRDLSSISSLRQENNELKNSIYDLESELTTLKSVQQENETLREQLNIPNKGDYNITEAHIIGGDLRSSNSSQFILDKGTSDGVKQDDVVVYSKFFIGRIAEVGMNSCVVDLISGGSLNIPSISEDNRTKGVLTGGVNTGLVMENILREEQLSEGEVILTSGIGGFPEDLILGEVIEIQGQDSDVEKKALVKKIIDISSLEDVIIIHVEDF